MANDAALSPTVQVRGSKDDGNNLVARLGFDKHFYRSGFRDLVATVDSGAFRSILNEPIRILRQMCGEAAGLMGGLSFAARREYNRRSISIDPGTLFHYDFSRAP